MRFGTVLRLAGVGAFLLLVALVGVVKSINVNKYSDVLAQAAKAATGRDMIVRGKISLRMSLNPALVANDVAIANAPWGAPREMLTVKRVEAEIGLLPLLAREVQVNRLVLTEPNLVLERASDGQANWDLRPAQQGKPQSFDGAGLPTTFRIGQVRIDGGRVIYKDGTGRQETLRIDRLNAQADTAASPIGVSASGTWNKQHFEASGVFGPINDLLSGTKPYPVKFKAVLPGLVASTVGTMTLGKASDPVVDLKLTAEATDIAEAAKLAGYALPALGAARINVNVTGPWSRLSLSEIDAALGRRDAVAVNAKGSVKDLAAARGIDLLLTAEGDNLGGFNKPLDWPLPAVGPVKATVHLTDGENGAWRLDDLKATVGHSDVSGVAVLHAPIGHPSLEAHLASTNIDLGELLHGTKGKEPAKEQPPQARMFPDDQLPLPMLSALDAQLIWKIDTLAGEGLTAQHIELPLSLSDGKLAATPTIGSIAGGKVAAGVNVDVTGKVPGVALTLKADKVVMGDLLRGLGVSSAVHEAQGDVRLNLKGSGNSMRALMARLNGDTLLVVGQGRIDGANADLIAVDVLKQLATWSPDKDNTDMQCLVSAFSVADGLARSEALLFDTANMTVGGKGSVNLANEVIDVTLAPKPKEASLLSLAVPVDVGGTLVNPSISPNKGAIVKGVASAVGAVALGPLGALVPLVSAGSGDDSNPCLNAVAQARKGAAGKKGAKTTSADGLGALLQGQFAN